MADRWEPTTDGYSFRFFSPEQVDKILCEGAQRGRTGSHAAIQRILKLEPGFERAELWRRIRQLKFRSNGTRYRRSVWSPEDDKILSRGYEKGWLGKQEAVRELLKRHPDWRPHLVWRRAKKLHLIQRIIKRGHERSCLTWSEDDDRFLLNLAGYKTSRVLAKMLHRSEAAVRYRLTVLGKSSRVHVEGFSRHALSRNLHIASATVHRMIARGLLEVRDPRITRKSLDNLRKSGRLEAVREGIATTSNRLTAGSRREDGSLVGRNPAAWNSASPSAPIGKPSRAQRVWTEVAKSLALGLEAVQDLIARGVLKLYDPTITEQSVRSFCRRHGSLINHDFLNRETREWLENSMDWVRTAGESASCHLAPLRKHALIVRRCNCGREIRGNAFFRHAKRCDQGASANIKYQTASSAAR
jgi:hypothetical protein